MDIATIERVVDLVERSQLHQVTVTEAGMSITVVNRLDTQHKIADDAELEAQQTAETVQSTGSLDKQVPSKPTPLKQVLSKNVGFVQFSPDGAVENLVQADDTIEVGQTVGYINVLSKLLPIVSEVAGVVVCLLVADGDGVDYGKPILQLRS